MAIPALMILLGGFAPRLDRGLDPPHMALPIGCILLERAVVVDLAGLNSRSKLSWDEELRRTDEMEIPVSW
jgi:hypothetical protein